MRAAGSALGGFQRPRPVVRENLVPYTARPLPAAPVSANVVPPPAGPASGPPPLPNQPGAGEYPDLGAELAAIDPALAKSLLDAGVSLTTTLVTEAPKWADDGRRGGGGGGGHRKHRRAHPKDDDDPPPPPPPPSVPWGAIGVGALLLVGAAAAAWAFTRPKPPPIRVIEERA